MYGLEISSMVVSGWVVVTVLYYFYMNRKEIPVGLFRMFVFVLLTAFGYYCNMLCQRVNERLWLDTHIDLPVRKQYVEEQEIQPDEYREDFLEIYDIVQELYQMRKVKGIPLEDLKAECLVNIDKASTNREYFLALQRFFAGLENMHTTLLYAKYSALAKAEWRLDSLYVISNFTGLPFACGDRILKVDGVNVLKWGETMWNYTAASTDEARKYYIAGDVFSSFTDTVRTFRMSRGDSIFTVEVPLYKRTEGNVPNDRIFDKKNESLEKIGFLSLEDFSDEAVRCFIRQVRNHRNRPYLIINLMDNPGGKVKNAFLLATFLMKHPYTVNKRITIRPDTSAYKGKLYVMINRGTSSAAELLSDMLKETGSATLVGDETGGDFGTFSLKFRTSHDTYFSVGSGIARKTVCGRLTEGMGVLPDIKISEQYQITNTKNILLQTFRQVWIDKMKLKRDSLKNRV